MTPGSRLIGGRLQQLLLLPGQGNRQALGEEADEGPAKVPAKKMSLGVVKLQGQPVGWSASWLVSWLVGNCSRCDHVKAAIGPPLVCHQFDAQ